MMAKSNTNGAATPVKSTAKPAPKAPVKPAPKPAVKTDAKTDAQEQPKAALKLPAPVEMKAKPVK
ncbi:CarD family transcriptional regulator, partial [Oxalobacteraceae bacterium OM1]